MVVKVYISGISGNKEVKKRQQRVCLILESKNVKYEAIDIAEPGSEDKKEFMQTKSTSNGGTISDPNPRHALPPQIFNEDEYCGDYDQFDMANEIDEMEKFLKLAPDDTAPTQTSNSEVKLGNGDVHNDVKEPAKEEEEQKGGEGGDDDEAVKGEKDTDKASEENGTGEGDNKKAPSVEKEAAAAAGEEAETKAEEKDEEQPPKEEANKAEEKEHDDGGDDDDEKDDEAEDE